MLLLFSPDISKKLVLRFILINIEYKKRCLYLQEIIAMSKRDELWRRALTAFFDGPVILRGIPFFSRN
ncbi:MAG: hypothetical protein ACT4OJ_15130 [Bacteroidota bacterium]